MNERDIAALTRGLMPVVQELIERSAGDLEKRLAAIEQRPTPERGEKGDAGEQGPPGAGAAGALIDRSGVLVLTLSDGRTCELGPVIGPQGEKGDAGADGTQGEKGDPGERGDPGAAGFGLNDFDVKAVDARTVELSFDGNDQKFMVELKFPVMIYSGVFKEGQDYERGDVVTWGGSLWHCDAVKTAAKPGVGDDWTLAVKKGRDGKDAK